MAPPRTDVRTPVPDDRRAPVTTRPRGGAGLDRGDVQGLVVSGYGRLREAVFLGVRIDDGAAGRALLSALLPHVTSASGRGTTTTQAVNVALGSSGLARLGLPRPALDMFSLEFSGGMVTPSRSAFLGDEGEQAPSTWAWGGPATPRVDALLLLYAATPASLASLAASVRGLLDGPGVAEAAALPTSTLSPLDHFGFADGISQPEVDELSRAGSGADDGNRSGHVPLGEFVLGYPNAYGRRTGRPLLPAAADPGGLLPRAPEDGGQADLGRNGTYLVVRTLAVDPAAFWDYARHEAARSGLPPVQVAAKMVGRWPSGTSLTVSPDEDHPGAPVDNGFRYHRDGDERGLRCPIASHVRRANPRDSLDPRPGSTASLQVNDRHRLIRRGRQYGPAAAEEPGAERGLHFLCLNANIGRQFEFVQHTWLNNPAFAGLQGSPDPIAGSRAPGADVFPCPALPVRHRFRDLPAFTRTRGGGYFFLPGIRALRYLASGTVAARPGGAAADPPSRSLEEDPE